MSTLQSETIDLAHLKTWLVKRLEDISDADSDVLADYVIALIQSDDPDEQIRSNCVENLQDFLQDNTDGFVNDVFTTIRSKSYLPPTQTQVKRTSLPGLSATHGPSFPQATAPPPNAPAGPTGHQQSSFGRQQQLGGLSDQSRKRSWNHRDANEQDQQPNRNGERPQKQMRRGGPGMRGGRGGAQPQPQQQQQQAANMSHVPQMAMPTPPPSNPAFDPQNAMASLMAMQAMGFPMPGLEQLAASVQPPQQQQQRHSRGRCRDYDTKGFCAKGSTCPYEHGSDHIVVPEEYDPSNSSLMLDIQQQSTRQPKSFKSQARTRESSSFPSTTPTNAAAGSHQQRGARGRDNHQRGTRASFSLSGPNHDARITSLVVEQIPEESFSLEAIQSFFADFGSIEDVSMQAYKRLAIVKFADYASAKRAYESPKVVFDNRFVKVYWYKPSDSSQIQESTRKAMNGETPSANSATDPTANGSGTQEGSSEPQMSPEEFEKRQAEAQRVHEEKARKIKEAEQAKAELDQKIKAQAEERRRLMEKLASKAKNPPIGSPALNGATTSPNGDTSAAPLDAKQAQKAKTTEALRAKLAELQAEAEAMGLPTEEPSASPFPQHPHAYGGGYTPRGRGSFRGRGGRGAWQGGSVARLDNRPKVVKLRVVDEAADLDGDEKGEALRGWLYTIGPFAAITPSPADTSGKQKETSVTFHERYVAEMFMASTTHTNGSIPGLGKVELSWETISPATAAAPTGVNGSAGAATKTSAPAEVVMGGGGGEGADTRKTMHEDVDYDVADEMDEDRWR